MTTLESESYVTNKYLELELLGDFRKSPINFRIVENFTANCLPSLLTIALGYTSTGGLARTFLLPRETRVREIKPPPWGFSQSENGILCHICAD